MLTCLALCCEPENVHAEWCNGCLANSGFEGLHDKLLLHSDKRLHAAGPMLIHWSATLVTECSKTYQMLR